MVSVCLPSDALLQHLLSYLGFSYLGRGVSLHGCFSKAQPLLLTLDKGYLLTAAPPDLEHGVAPLLGYYLDIKLLSNICFKKIFSHSLGFLFTLLFTCCDEAYKLDLVLLVYFCCLCFEGQSQKILA